MNLEPTKNEPARKREAESVREIMQTDLIRLRYYQDTSASRDFGLLSFVDSN